MTADQLNMLIGVINGAVSTLGWVIGISVTVFLACFGGAVGLIFRQNAQRMDSLESQTKRSEESAEEAKREVQQMSSHCAQMRAGCREQFLTRYVTDTELKDMEREFKDLVHETLRRLEAQLADNRTTLVTALEQVKRDITGAVVNHTHDANGQVLIRREAPR
jgi:septal ring factor EnvC (AmiA/AmiB activator)